MIKMAIQIILFFYTYIHKTQAYNIMLNNKGL